MQSLQKKARMVHWNVSHMIYMIGVYEILSQAVISSGLWEHFVSGKIRLLILAVGIGCMLVYYIARSIQVEFSFYDILWILFLVMVLERNYALQASNYFRFLNYFSALLIAFWLKNSDEWIPPALRLFFWVYMVYAIATIVLYFNPGLYLNHVVKWFPNTQGRLIRWYNQGCMAGITEHYSTNGMLLAMGMLVYACNLLNPSGKKWMSLGAFGVTAIAMLLTGKRGPLLAVAFTLLLFYSLYHASDKNFAKKLLKFFGVLLGIGMLLLVLYRFVPALATFVTRFQETMSQGDVTMNRTSFWNLAWAQFKQHPLFGIGWFQFNRVSMEQLGIEAFAHNIYLEILCENGVIGTCIVLGFFLCNAIFAIRTFVKIRTGKICCTKNVQYRIAFAVCMQVFFLFYGMTGNPLYDQITNIPYFLSCALCYYYRDLLYKNTRRREFQKRMAQQRISGMNVSAGKGGLDAHI